MLNRWFGPKAHEYLHFLGFAVLAAGLPFNKVLMSIGAIWGAANVVLMGDYTESFRRLRSNRLFLLVFSLFAVHIVGLLWSENLAYGLDDIRKKLPLLAVPIAFAAGPRLSNMQTSNLLLLFTGSVFIASVLNCSSFLNSSDTSIDFRAHSLFISHIRFALMVVAALFIALYFALKPSRIQILGIILALWFAFYLFYSQVISGIIGLSGGLFLLLVYRTWHLTWLRFTLLLLPFVLFVTGVALINSTRNDIAFKETVKPLTTTKSGDYYHHDWNNNSRENGNLIYRNIYDPELNEEWPKRSNVSLDHQFQNGAYLRDNLYRYMSSLGLTKDSIGLSKLNSRDIVNIEKGYTSALIARPGILGRIASLRFQLENNHDPNSSTLFQRLAYWEAGIRIYLREPVIGVGTGDVQEAFDIHYNINDSVLTSENRRRAHNTYITALLTWGPIGLLLLLTFLYQFLKRNRTENAWLAFVFIGIVGFSFFNEDTLETQSGISLFVFLIGLFLCPPSSTTTTQRI